MNGRSDWLVPEARADLAVVVQAMSEHWPGQVSLVDPPHVSFGSIAMVSRCPRDFVLPPKTDIHRKARHVSKVPIPEVASLFDHPVDAGPEGRLHLHRQEFE